ERGLDGVEDAAVAGHTVDHTVADHAVADHTVADHIAAGHAVADRVVVAAHAVTAFCLGACRARVPSPGRLRNPTVRVVREMRRLMSGLPACVRRTWPRRRPRGSPGRRASCAPASSWRASWG